MSRAKLQAAQELIRERNYDAARAILVTINHPTAYKWLRQLDEISRQQPKHKNNLFNQSQKTRKRRTPWILVLVAFVCLFATYLATSTPLSTTSRIRQSTATNSLAMMLPATNEAMMTLQAGVVMNITPATETPKPSPSATLTQMPTSTPLAPADASATSLLITVWAGQTRVFITPSATITSSPSPTPLPTIPTKTPMPSRLSYPESFYTLRVANARSCPSTDCSLVTRYEANDMVLVIGRANGQTYQGSDLWWWITDSLGDMFIHSSLLAEGFPPPPTFAPLPTLVPLPEYDYSYDDYDYDDFDYDDYDYDDDEDYSSGGCPGMSFTCSSLSCDEAYACMRAGNGRLDGDNDGVPCESVC